MSQKYDINRVITCETLRGDPLSLRIYYRAVARDVGIYAAVVYGVLGSRPYKEKQEWIPFTYKEMIEETGLTERQVRLAYKKLKHGGYICYKISYYNGAPTCHFKVNL